MIVEVWYVWPFFAGCLLVAEHNIRVPGQTPALTFYETAVAEMLGIFLARIYLDNNNMYWRRVFPLIDKLI